MPLFTCITTTYNEGNLLKDAIDSILSQKFTDLECIIVSDGADSRTESVLSKIEAPNIRVLRQANDGLSSARNRALSSACGDYVCFLDADDIRPPWALAAVADLIEAECPDMIISRGVLRDVRGKLEPFYDDRIFDRLRSNGAVVLDLLSTTDQKMRRLAHLIEPQSANKFIRRELLNEDHIRFPNTHFFEDIYFHNYCLSRAQRLGIVDYPTFIYNRRYRHPQITSSNSDVRFDIIAVARLTLDMFSRQWQFSDEIWRSVVFLSCMRIVKWCNDTISHHYRYEFNQMARIMIKSINPIYKSMAKILPEELSGLNDARQYAEEMI